MLLQILDTWSLRLHVESNKTPRFLGGSLLGVMRESPMFMPICWFWLVLLWVVITISSVLSSFSFKRLLVIHILISLIQASRQDIAVSFDTDTPGWKEIYILKAAIVSLMKYTWCNSHNNLRLLSERKHPCHANNVIWWYNFLCVKYQWN